MNVLRSYNRNGKVMQREHGVQSGTGVCQESKTCPYDSISANRGNSGTGNSGTVLNDPLFYDEIFCNKVINMYLCAVSVSRC